MPSFRQIVGAVVTGLAMVAAAPAGPRISARSLKMYNAYERRQNPATGLPDGLTDIDVLQFALTLENLETAFYQQGFAMFPDSDFAALGLAPEDITNLKSIGGTEATHVTTLTSAVAGAGIQPVLPCKYKFGFTDATAMVATAGILENVGVSAYLGAAPIVKSAAILGTAASIVTVEARHQTFIRVASKAVAIPSAFDTPLGIRNVFTLAAGFIESCPEGSNLAITPFPALTMTTPAAAGAAAPAAGSTIKVTSTATGATQCAFSNGGIPGGTAFAPFTDGGCEVPQNLAGFTYVNLASDAPGDGVLTDAITLAGPMVMIVS
ncbi:ferritin-like domain-containing protein [Amylocarpus encephaloides]|uniref:Ferritin-like domain-containing protein n=1 Tax=Amylocarpus encephaloides TaxID=45428 RepID=A0A9P7YEX8_9HELO|nr:ferritin-like domain-containing protein [Amylocarpus encephaloides]